MVRSVHRTAQVVRRCASTMALVVATAVLALGLFHQNLRAETQIVLRPSAVDCQVGSAAVGSVACPAAVPPAPPGGR